MNGITAKIILTAAAVWPLASTAVAQEGFDRTVLGIESDRGALKMTLELSLKTDELLPFPVPYGDFLVSNEIQPGSAEETILQYIQRVGNGDIPGFSELHEPRQGNTPCRCGSPFEPRYRIPAKFKVLTFEQAWIYRDYQIFQINFRVSDRRSSIVSIAVRYHEGQAYIASRPSGPAFEAASFIVMLAKLQQMPVQPERPPNDSLDLTVQIEEGTNPLTVHFGGMTHSSSLGWRPAHQSAGTDPVTAFAANVLATSATIDDQTFIGQFHPWLSDSLQRQIERNPDFLNEVRDFYTTTSDIAHVFTFDIGHRLLHIYATRDQPDRLRYMLIMRDHGTLTLGGFPSGFGLESLTAIEAVERYLLERWRGQ